VQLETRHAPRAGAEGAVAPWQRLEALRAPAADEEPALPNPVETQRGQLAVGPHQEAQDVVAALGTRSVGPQAQAVAHEHVGLAPAEVGDPSGFEGSPGARRPELRRQDLVGLAVEDDEPRLRAGLRQHGLGRRDGVVGRQLLDGRGHRNALAEHEAGDGRTPPGEEDQEDGAQQRYRRAPPGEDVEAEGDAGHQGHQEVERVPRASEGIELREGEGGGEAEAREGETREEKPTLHAGCDEADGEGHAGDRSAVRPERVEEETARGGPEIAGSCVEEGAEPGLLRAQLHAAPDEFLPHVGRREQARGEGGGRRGGRQPDGAPPREPSHEDEHGHGQRGRPERWKGAVVEQHRRETQGPDRHELASLVALDESRQPEEQEAEHRELHRIGPYQLRLEDRARGERDQERGQGRGSPAHQRPRREIEGRDGEDAAHHRGRAQRRHTRVQGSEAPDDQVEQRWVGVAGDLRPDLGPVGPGGDRVVDPLVGVERPLEDARQAQREPEQGDGAQHPGLGSGPEPRPPGTGGRRRSVRGPTARPGAGAAHST
jgi:hypothetical protein